MSLISIIGTPLYQWETGRKLKVIPLRGMRVDSVHISNYGDKTALVVKPREENGAYIADIPNILLQDDRSIAVYSVNVSEDKTETLRECVFSIQKRAKPSDYIYTETEVFTYKALEERISQIEKNGVGEGRISEAVKEYLDKNPISESDPSVPNWAKSPEKPKYSAEEVGALSQDALGEGVNQALQQAKESGAFDGKDGNDYILTEDDKQEIADMISVPEIPGGSGEYEESTRLDIRDMIEKGCFLLSSTGLPSNKTTAMVDAGYVKLAVSPGEKYRVTAYIPTSSGIIFYADDGNVLTVDEGGKAGGNVRVKDYEVTVPEGCTTMGVSTRKRTSDPIIVKRVQVKSMTPQVIGEELAEQKNTCAEDECNDDNRMFAIESRLGFSFNGLDKGKVIFMTDGTRSILSDVYAILKAHGMPFSVAPVWNTIVNNPTAMNDNSTELEFLHMVEDDGGEIYAHSMNGDALTADTAEEMLRESKRWLTEEGFTVRGWIAPRGVFCPEARELYAKYYRYGYRASDKKDSPLNFERPYLSTLGLDGAKAAIDACESDKSVIVLFHHWSDNEIEGFNLEDLEALLTYIEGKNVDVTTYRDCFFNHGSYGATGEVESGSGIEVSGAEVGQILKVKEVDENGVPTAWETAEMPKSITEDRVSQMISEALGGVENGNY